MRTLTKFYGILLACMMLVAPDLHAQSTSPSTKWHWNEGTIVVDTPERPAGQQHALGMTAEKIDIVRIAFIGVGGRGRSAVYRYASMPGVEIVALCDHEKERAEAGQKFLRDKGLAPAKIYYGAEGYKEICNDPKVDLVYIATDWNHHYPIAKYAMEHGKHAVIEVPAAMNLEQCWGLINTVEKYRKHCMMLENCCYDWFEMDILNMIQNNVFGEILYVRGAYLHTLGTMRGSWVDPDNNPLKMGWRLKYNMENRGDLYPTHGLGPIAQALNIHRGDRLVRLVAMDTKSVVGKACADEVLGRDCGSFKNGDHTTTLMQTANGKVVEVQHNIMDPQPYNRLYQLSGTKGIAVKYPTEGLCVDPNHLKKIGYTPKSDKLQAHEYMPKEEMEALREYYKNPVAKKIGALAKKVGGGHGGMDFMMDARLIYCLRNGLPLDMDVYDLAEWSCEAELSALSLNHKNASVEIPDFTRGYWNTVKGFKHAWADDAEEKRTDAIADKYARVHKDAVKKYDLWNLYDQMNKYEGEDKARAEKKYQQAVDKAQKTIAKEMKK